MITQLRHELQALWAELPCSRPPTLRRCRHENALLATNLPFIASSADVRHFTDVCRLTGWTVSEKDGWLLLDHPVPVPDCRIPQTPSGEIGCLISLLLRHPQDDAPCEGEIRALAKVCEESPAAAELFCASLHENWAQRLRRHEPLPGGLLPYLCFAHAKCKEEHK